MHTRVAVAAILFTSGAMAFTAMAMAQHTGYPGKSVRMVIPYAAGGGPDVVARIIADKITVGWNQNFVDCK
jgi:tripartite-type tricarboxylate transporter receptor subunit TctC